jgi:Ser-tRNA(Ala) deacylase AlaX
MDPTKRLYWSDEQRLESNAIVIGVHADGLALNQTCFYPGGGGQPADNGTITIGDYSVAVLNVEASDKGCCGTMCAVAPQPGWLGQIVHLRVEPVRRAAFSRYHTILHVLNTIALRDYGAWITGAQIGVDYSRIDFKWDGFSPAICGEVEQKVNTELVANRHITAYLLDVEQFSRRPDLLRTLEVKPPVIDGHVRVVEIEGFDAQACGGTHVSGTRELGRFSITRTENKGRINKRLYVRLT